MLKLKIGAGTKAAQNNNNNNNASADGQRTPQTPAASAPTPGGGFKLKLSVSQPPTPSQPGPSSTFPQPTATTAEKKKRTYTKKNPDAIPKSKKRALEDDGAAPNPKRKISLKLGTASSAPASDASKTGPKLSLSKKQSRPQPKLLDIRARGKVPPRPKGVGYDSEDSDTEKDPAIQQALILRMEAGPDADYLRSAITEGRIGPHPSQGDAEVSFKFIERNYRRAMIKIQGRCYAAALVDLPCVVESMKSFDKKGWWKVADIAQMLLVLGRCETEEQAKMMPLPREVNKDTYQYAHGLTPPMHWVRKRRFRKRLNYNEVLNVEEEVNRLLQADKEWEERGGKVTSARAGDAQQHEQGMQDLPEEDDEADGDEQGADGNGYHFNLGDEDAEGELDDAVETVEHDEEMEEGDPDLEAGLQAMFDENEDEGAGDMSQLVSDSPAPIVDQAASMTGVEHALQPQQHPQLQQHHPSDMDATPVGTPAGEMTEEHSDDEGEEEDDDEEEDEEDESDDDDDDDADSPDVVDEDAAAKAAERAQQLEEVADLQREVEKARSKVASMTNQLLAQREKKKLLALEEELNMKKQVFGLDLED